MSQIEQVDLRTQLRAIPARNESMAHQSLPGGGLAFNVEAAKPGVFVGALKRVLKIPHRCKTMQLDPLGAEVFLACDGRKTVEEISEGFAAAHRLTFHEARLGVMQFLKLLMQHGAVGIALPRESADEAEQDQK